MHTLESLHAELSAQLDKYEQAGVDAAEVNAVRNWHARVATMVSKLAIKRFVPSLYAQTPQPNDRWISLI